MAEALLAVMDAGCGARRLVVLKRIWPELASDPEFMTMFMDEARLSVRLDHPNLVRTFEVVDDADGVAIAMEYLDGQPLTRVLNRLRDSGGLSIPLRLRILSSVLAGLDHAHALTDLDGTSLGVVHRDVSPQNVFVTYVGQVKLVDFGVAKTLAASHHTCPGALKGKLAYMAPEQLQAGPIDRRADLFAVGVMLWEMLAQRRMWQGMSEVQIVTHLSLGLPFPTLPSEASVPAGLDAICARALHPNPDLRYQTAAEMEMDLDRVSVGAADSHARDLGKIVAHAFADDRTARQALIESGAWQTTAPETLPLVEAPAVESESNRSVDTRGSDTRGSDTRGSEAIGSHLGVENRGTNNLGVEAPVARATVAPPSTARIWSRRVAAAAAMAAVLATLLRLEGERLRPMVADKPAPVAETAPPAPGALPPLAPSTAALQTGRATIADGSGARDVPRARRHHHRSSPDEDATLPPTLAIDGEPLGDPLDALPGDPAVRATDRHQRVPPSSRAWGREPATKAP